MKFIRKLGDTHYMRRTIEKNRMNIIMYSSLAVFILFVYHVLSDGDFSFLLTLGSIIGLFGFSILMFKVVNQRSVSGVSIKTLELYASVFVFRLCSILFYDGYLPFDRSGDWLYQTIEALSLVAVLINIFLVLKTFAASYDRKYDTFGTMGSMPTSTGALFILLPCLLVALFVHPSLNSNFVTDTAWTAAMYIEGLAVLPQLVMFQRKGGEIESFTSHFVFCLGVSRFMHFLFWVSSYHELNDRYSKEPLSGGWFVGYIVLASQIIQLLLMGDFLYYYFKSVRSGGPMLLPSFQV